jgi:hypothetical protein
LPFFVFAAALAACLALGALVWSPLVFPWAMLEYGSLYRPTRENEKCEVCNPIRSRGKQRCVRSRADNLPLSPTPRPAATMLSAPSRTARLPRLLNKLNASVIFAPVLPGEDLTVRAARVPRRRRPPWQTPDCWARSSWP